MTNQSEGRLRAVDSLSAYEFQVELDGQPIGGIFSVRGMTPFMLDGHVPPLLISKMVQKDPANPFNQWTRATRTEERPTRDIAIVAVDEGAETRRWVYKNAYITQISYSDFDTALSELVEERITIQAESIEEVWAEG